MRTMVCMLFSVLLLPHLAPGQPLTTQDIRNLSGYIKTLQYVRQKTTPQYSSTGAFRLSQGAGAVSPDGTKYWQVNPYFTNLGLMGFMKSNEKGKFGMVRNWLSWYITHIRSNGVIYNHWCTDDGRLETTTPNCEGATNNDADSYDSYAATFLSLAYQYYHDSGDKTWFTPLTIAKLELLGDLLIDLQQKDGLTIAKPDYPVKYLMDNAEVYAGFVALSKIEGEINRNTSLQRKYATAAAKVQKGINTGLYDAAKGLYHTAMQGSIPTYANLKEWYPGTTALIWPQLFGVAGPAAPISVKQRDALKNAWKNDKDWTKYEVSPDHALFPSIGYAFSAAGDKKTGGAQAQFIIKKLTFPEVTQPMWNIADAGWLIQNGIIR